MNASLLIQYAVIGVVVAVAAVFVVRKYWPRGAKSGDGCDSSDGGCSTCGACASAAPPPDVIVVAPPAPRRRT